LAVKAGKIITLLEEFAPRQLQATWDNSGLQVGDRQWLADRVLLALDITLDVIQYAVTNKFNFILSHHPLIFHKLARVDVSTPMGNIIATALKEQISAYAMHTNLDVVSGGVSDVLASLLKLEQIMILDKQKGDYYKLAVYVPSTHLDLVRQALGDAGAGWIGNYSHCSFASVGFGRFLPKDGAKPWIGCKGKMEEVEEYKLESLVEGHKLSGVLSAMKSAHPYDEIAYDLVKMSNDAKYGLGRIGLLPEPMSLGAFSTLLGDLLGCYSLKITGDEERAIKKVAVCGGSGSNYVALSHRSGADVLVTGDIGHHAALEALQLGLALVDPGHYYSEHPIISRLESFLKDTIPGLVVVQYPGCTDPLWTKTMKS